MSTQQEIPGYFDLDIPWREEIKRKREVDAIFKEFTGDGNTTQTIIPDDVKGFSRAWWNLHGVKTMPK